MKDHQINCPLWYDTDGTCCPDGLPCDCPMVPLRRIIDLTEAEIFSDQMRLGILAFAVFVVAMLGLAIVHGLVQTDVLLAARAPV